MGSVVLNKAFPLPVDMLSFPFCKPPNLPRQQVPGFTILEVLVAVSIAASVIGLLATTLIRQITLGEESGRLTAVEAVVSRDLNWFANYAALWKLRFGTYDVSSDITQVSRSSPAAAVFYVPTDANCNSLAASLLNDAQNTQFSSEFSPPYSITHLNATTIQVPGVGGVGVIVSRTITPVGNRVRISYVSSVNGFSFRREASLLVEAGAWCDRLP